MQPFQETADTVMHNFSWRCEKADERLEPPSRLSSVLPCWASTKQKEKERIHGRVTADPLLSLEKLCQNTLEGNAKTSKIQNVYDASEREV